MMKKNGFTLAEVLITLAIIGVVATLTLPALMTNTAEQQAMTAYKKMMNTLNEAGQMNAALEGFDYTSADARGAIGDTIADNKQTLTALFKERLQVNPDIAGSDFQGNGGKCANLPLVLRDGTAICLQEQTAEATPTGNKQFWVIYVDTNGPKGPNKPSECSDDNCKTKTGKKINDQFVTTLYKGLAIPGKWTEIDTLDTTGAETKASLFAMGIGKRSASSTSTSTSSSGDDDDDD